MIYHRGFFSDVHRRLIGKCYISYLVHPGWCPGITVCLSISGIYDMIYRRGLFSDFHRHLIGKCHISFLVHPGWSPGITVCLSTSGISKKSLPMNAEYETTYGWVLCVIHFFTSLQVPVFIHDSMFIIRKYVQIYISDCLIFMFFFIIYYDVILKYRYY